MGLRDMGQADDGKGLEGDHKDDHAGNPRRR
jgi:hypothetical protein